MGEDGPIEVGEEDFDGKLVLYCFLQLAGDPFSQEGEKTCASRRQGDFSGVSCGIGVGDLIADSFRTPCLPGDGGEKFKIHR